MKTGGQSSYSKAGAEIPPDYVLTPGGFRLRSFSYSIQEHQVLSREEGNLVILDPSTGEMVDLMDAFESVQPLFHASNSWVTYGYWQNDTGTPISLFSTKWIVPPPPATQSGQAIFLFNALTNAAGSEIVQPVLQWGPSFAGGGDFWAIANWYVDSAGRAYCSRLVPVAVGDSLSGMITLVQQSGGSFVYRSEFLGFPETVLNVPATAEFVVATETLEAHRIAQCQDYPACPRTQMTSIDLRTGASSPQLVWNKRDQIVDCGQKTELINPANPGGEIDLVY